MRSLVARTQLIWRSTAAWSLPPLWEMFEPAPQQTTPQGEAPVYEVPGGATSGGSLASLGSLHLEGDSVAAGGASSDAEFDNEDWAQAIASVMGRVAESD